MFMYRYMHVLLAFQYSLQSLKWFKFVFKVPGLIGYLGYSIVYSRKIEIFWSAPFQPNGIIQEYQITVSTASTDLLNLTVSWNRFLLCFKIITVYHLWHYVMSHRLDKILKGIKLLNSVSELSSLLFVRGVNINIGHDVYFIVKPVIIKTVNAFFIMLQHIYTAIYAIIR